MLFVDADNGLGSPSGDVDDAFALVALFAAKAPIAGIASTAGNTTEALAFENNRRLAQLCGFTGSVLNAEEAVRHLRAEEKPQIALCLGPLTNVARALSLGPLPNGTRVIALGSNYSSVGRWPPYWPYEFNFTKDKAALKAVFHSSLPMTVAPLDVARRLQAGRKELKRLPGNLGAHLRAHSVRWLRRKLWLGGLRFPVWDLVPALYVLWPERFHTKTLPATLHFNGWIQYGRGDREITVILDYDPDALWAAFERLFAEAFG